MPEGRRRLSMMKWGPIFGARRIIKTIRDKIGCNSCRKEDKNKISRMTSHARARTGNLALTQFTDGLEFWVVAQWSTAWPVGLSDLFRIVDQHSCGSPECVSNVREGDTNFWIQFFAIYSITIIWQSRVTFSYVITLIGAISGIHYVKAVNLTAVPIKSK